MASVCDALLALSLKNTGVDALLAASVKKACDLEAASPSIPFRALLSPGCGFLLDVSSKKPDGESLLDMSLKKPFEEDELLRDLSLKEPLGTLPDRLCSLF